MADKNIQDKELKNVSGGSESGSAYYKVVCQSCGTEFDKNTAETLKIGCSSDHDTLKCPGCGKWVDWDGKVQDV